jgi:ribose 5-phosphate isomerase RpiB
MEDKGNLEILAEKIEDFVKEQGYEVRNIGVKSENISVYYEGSGRSVVGEINFNCNLERWIDSS